MLLIDGVNGESEECNEARRAGNQVNAGVTRLGELRAMRGLCTEAASGFGRHAHNIDVTDYQTYNYIHSLIFSFFLLVCSKL